ncbi:hypothetical protein CR513_62941, partial [Mucuna pruriens]
MRQMPKICKSSQLTTRVVALYYITLVVLGVDILGPFPAALGQVKYLIVIEAEPIATISTERINCFYWKKTICQFGLPAKIVSDNRTQFTSRTTVNFCTQLKIKQLFTSMLVKRKLAAQAIHLGVPPMYIYQLTPRWEANLKRVTCTPGREQERMNK